MAGTFWTSKSKRKASTFAGTASALAPVLWAMFGLPACAQHRGTVVVGGVRVPSPDERLETLRRGLAAVVVGGVRVPSPDERLETLRRGLAAVADTDVQGMTPLEAARTVRDASSAALGAMSSDLYPQSSAAKAVVGVLSRASVTSDAAASMAEAVDTLGRLGAYVPAARVPVLEEAEATVSSGEAAFVSLVSRTDAYRKGGHDEATRRDLRDALLRDVLVAMRLTPEGATLEARVAAAVTRRVEAGDRAVRLSIAATSLATVRAGMEKVRDTLAEDEEGHLLRRVHDVARGALAAIADDEAEVGDAMGGRVEADAAKP